MNQNCPNYLENEWLRGQPIGMYHCPYCGEMVLAGLDTRPLCKYGLPQPVITPTRARKDVPDSPAGDL